MSFPIGLDTGSHIAGVGNNCQKNNKGRSITSILYWACQEHFNNLSQIYWHLAKTKTRLLLFVVTII